MNKKAPSRKRKTTAKKQKQTKELIKKNEPVITIYKESMTEIKILEAFDMLGITAKLDDRTKRLFLAVARENNLNPLKREIHAVERQQKYFERDEQGRNIEKWRTVLTPVTGYEVFIDRAEESGRLQYWFPESEGKVEDGTLQTTVTIKRKDWPREFHWTVYYKEVRPDKLEKAPVWQKEPHHMTEKVCISRAFRLCFRDILRGMPYTVEEEATIQNQERHVMPEIKDPEEKPLDAVDAEIVSEATDLEAVKTECSNLRRDMSGTKKFTTDELKECTNQFLAAGNDIKKLRSLYGEWSDILFVRRKEKVNG
jgi:hypothetical protein